MTSIWRCGTSLRWAHNDADTFAPSLYKRHRKRVKARTKHSVQPANAPLPNVYVQRTTQESLGEVDSEFTPTPDPAAEPCGGLASCAARDADGREELQSIASTIGVPLNAPKREPALSVIGFETTDSKQTHSAAISVGSKRRKRALAKRRSQHKVARFRRGMTTPIASREA